MDDPTGMPSWDEVVKQVNDLRDQGLVVFVDRFVIPEFTKYGEADIRLSFYLKPEDAK
jgi:hypothetical protein